MLPSERISKGWCQGTYARDEHGKDVDIWAQGGKAEKWCAVGALHTARIDGSITDDQMDDLVQFIAANFCRKLSIPSWNDLKRMTKTEVLRAMKAAEQEILGVTK